LRRWDGGSGDWVIGDVVLLTRDMALRRIEGMDRMRERIDEGRTQL